MRRLLLALVLCIASSTAFAQSLDHPRNEVSGDRGWKAEWDEVVAAAKKEGKLVVCMSPSVGRRDFLLKQWKADYPEIDLSLSIAAGSTFVPAIITERSAGRYQWDVFHSGPNSGVTAIRAGLLDPLLPELILPEAKDPAPWGGWDEAFYDRERKYILGLSSDVQTAYYNAKVLAPERANRLGLKVLLEPDMKGKIYWFDPRGTGTGAPFLVLVERVLGREAWRKIMVEQDPTFVSSHGASAEAVVRGKAAIAFSGPVEENLREFRNAGLQFDVRDLGHTPETAYLGTDGATLAVFNKRPHPNAARVFVNWIMTKRIAEGMAVGSGYDSRRSDVPSVNPNSRAIPGAKYVMAQKDENDELLRELQSEMKTLRPK